MAARDPLPAAEVDRLLAEHEGWRRVPGREAIEKTYRLDYFTSVQAINDLMEPARDLAHHPDIDLRWETLRIVLTTYSAGERITALDFLLVASIEQVLGAYLPR